MKEKKSLLRISILGILLVHLTTLIIYFYYGDFLFSKWPWFKVSIVLSLITNLIPYCFYFFSKKSKLDSFSVALIYIFPFLFVYLLIIPSYRELGLDSDPNGINCFSTLALIHCSCVYWIHKTLSKIDTYD